MGGLGGLGGVSGMGGIMTPQLSVQLDSAVVWLAADKITGLAQGAAVSSWTNAGSLGSAFTQATESLQPAYQASVAALNNNPAVRFTSDRMSLASGNFTVFSLYAAIVPTGTGYREVLSKGSDASNRNLYSIAYQTTDVWVFGFTSAPGTYREVQSDAALISGSAAIVGGIWNGTTITNDLNGTIKTADPGDTPQQVGTSLFIGDLMDTGTEFFSQDIAEILFFDIVLSVAQRNLVRRYLGAKYGVTVS